MDQPGFPPIQQRLMEFIRKEFHPGYNHYNVNKLIGDASARQYFRYVSDSKVYYILAANPEPFDPDRFPYKQVYDLLRSIDLPVPEIVAMDGSLGIVLQEDLGNESVQRRLMETGKRDASVLLRRAIDHILVLQKEGTPRLQPGMEAYRLAFDEEKLSFELRFFRRHYLQDYRGIAPDERRLTEEFSRLATELSRCPRFLCHRDYHIRNLMLKDGQIYVIDFQDARWGPVCYDLVSLLKDSIELQTEEISDLIEYYLEQAKAIGFFALNPPDFQRQFNLMCIQRLLKALGTYGYQITSRGNFIYEQYIAGSLHRALLSLQRIAEFPYIQSIVETELSR